MTDEIEQTDDIESIVKQIVDINSIFRVEIDEFNHTLLQYREGGEVIAKGKYVGQLTKPKWEVVGYFPNMVEVLKEVVSLSLLQKDVIDIEKYIIRIEDLIKELKR